MEKDHSSSYEVGGNLGNIEKRPGVSGGPWDLVDGAAEVALIRREISSVIGAHSFPTSRCPQGRRSSEIHPGDKRCQNESEWQSCTRTCTALCPRQRFVWMPVRETECCSGQGLGRVRHLNTRQLQVRGALCDALRRQSRLQVGSAACALQPHVWREKAWLRRRRADLARSVRRKGRCALVRPPPPRREKQGIFA